MLLYEDQESRGLHGLGEAEFVGGLQGIDKVIAGIGEPQHLCAGGLRLEQKG